MKLYILLQLAIIAQALPVPSPDEGEEIPRGGWGAARPVYYAAKASDTDAIVTEGGVSLLHSSCDEWDLASAQPDDDFERGGPLPGGDKLVKRPYISGGKSNGLPPHDGKRDEKAAGWGADFPTGAGKREEVGTDATMIEYALAHKDDPTYQSRSDAGVSSNSRRRINPLSGLLHGGATTSTPRSDADDSSNSRRRGWCSDWPTRVR